MKNLGVHPYVFPMPVLLIATYGKDGKVDVMNMAWGGVCASDMVALNIDEDHKTTENLKLTKAFTLSVADREHMAEADWFGIGSGNDLDDKFERTGLTAVRSEFVNAPVVEEFPLTLECEVVEMGETVSGYKVIGRIKNVKAREDVLGEDGNVDVAKLHAIVFDQVHNGYYEVGAKVGQAWGDGLKYSDK